MGVMPKSYWVKRVLLFVVLEWRRRRVQGEASGRVVSFPCVIPSF